MPASSICRRRFVSEIVVTEIFAWRRLLSSLRSTGPPFVRRRRHSVWPMSPVASPSSPNHVCCCQWFANSFSGGGLSPQTAFRPRRRQPHPGASSAGASSAGQRQVQAEQAAVPLKGAQVAVPLKGVQAAMPLKGVQATLSFLSPKGVQAAVPQERGEATATTMLTTTFEVL
jgi:hypothetical protein